MRKLKKNEKQLTDSYRICLYCGEDEVEKIGHDYETWYECDCKDAKLEREIKEQISKLEYQLPRHKYTIETARAIRRIED